MILVTSLPLRKPNMPHVMQQHTQIQIAASAAPPGPTLTACHAPAPHTSPHVVVFSAREVMVDLPPAAEQPQRLSESQNTSVRFAHRDWKWCVVGQVLLAVSSSGSSSADIFPAPRQSR